MAINTKARGAGASNAVYRHVLENYLAGNVNFSANSVARVLQISPNTVNIAIRALASIGAASISRRSFALTDFEKALMYWAATRKLSRSIAYSTFTGIGVQNIEAKMPEGIAFTAYSAYSFAFGNDIAGYGEVYVYATDFALKELERRFPKAALSSHSDYADLIVLKPDKVLYREIEEKLLKNSCVPITQACVDLWNIKGWQAPRFFASAMKKLGERLNTAMGE